MANELNQLLFRIRDGLATTVEVQRAHTLVMIDERLPVGLRQAIDFREDAVGDAVGLLAVLGADSLFGEVLREGIAADLAEVDEHTLEASNRDELLLEEVWPLAEAFVAAVRQEAGTIEMAAAVLDVLGLESPQLPVAEAVYDEAGVVEIAVDWHVDIEQAWVSAMVDGELPPEARHAAIRKLREDPAAGAEMTVFATLGSDLRAAVQDEAGETPYLWSGVAEGIGVDAEAVAGWDGALFAAAVRAQAGEIQLADEVMAQVVTPLPSMVEEPPPLPQPANSRRWGGLLMALAAAAVLMVALPTTWNQNTTGTAAPVAQASAQFASAGEIVVEALEHGDNSTVHQIMGDQGAVILWIDEGEAQ